VIKIVTDSTCYLPPALLAEYDIQVIPLTLLFGRRAYREGIDMDTEQFFEKLSREKTFPTTSQPNTQDFLSAWQPLLDAGHEVLSILLSGRLSGTLEAAQAAAQLLPRGAPLSIVDSLSVAMGLGMQVLRAAEMARAGLSRERIVAAIERMRKTICITLVLDTLEYVHRGGRINTAQAWVGTLLRVKPMLTLRKGVIEPLEQVRTAQRAFTRMLDRTLHYLGDDRRPWISVMHSRSPGAANRLLDALKPRFPGARFFCSEIGPVLGVHVGPGGLGVIACPSTAL
jgi:DegV family protein with EDD domain